MPPPPPPSPNDTTATSVLISWNPPLNPNGEIRNYTVNFVAVRLVSGSSTSRRRRQASDNTLDECIVGGQNMINRNQTVPGNQTSAMLVDLSKWKNCYHE